MSDATPPEQEAVQAFGSEFVNYDVLEWLAKQSTRLPAYVAAGRELVNGGLPEKRVATLQLVNLVFDGLDEYPYLYGASVDSAQAISDLKLAAETASIPWAELLKLLPVVLEVVKAIIDTLNK